MRGVAGRFEWLQMHARERADDFQMAQFFRADVHQQVFAFRIVAIEALNGILHGRGEFAIGAAELLQQHVAESRVGHADRARCTSTFLHGDTLRPLVQRERMHV